MPKFNSRSYTIGNLYSRLFDYFKIVSYPVAAYEVEVLLCFVLNCKRHELFLNHSKCIDRHSVAKILTYARRRRTGKPLAYILKQHFFYSKYITVNHNVLIPRPETESLIEIILSQNNELPKNVFDCCTGSGVIGSVLSDFRPCWTIVASDISQKALSVAQVNCSRGVSLLCTDMVASIKNMPYFDLIVCNPPYISTQELEHVNDSVKKWEPYEALYGGEYGLDYYIILASRTPCLLKHSGKLYAEIGSMQSVLVRQTFEQYHWRSVEILPDMSGNPRILIALPPL